jgi:hypothetical protein
MVMDPRRSPSKRRHTYARRFGDSAHFTLHGYIFHFFISRLNCPKVTVYIRKVPRFTRPAFNRVQDRSLDMFGSFDSPKP